MDNNLKEVFDLVEEEKKIILPPAIIKKPIIKDDPVDSSLIPDFSTARENIDAIMDMGRIALEKVLEIAQEGQHPRFYEAAAMLIKNLSDANKDYMDIHEKVSRIRKNNSESGHENASLNPKINIENAVFTGTATDLLNSRNPKKIIDIT